jgi:DNA-directed RNA polymerase specialized sigma24 family protein
MVMARAKQKKYDVDSNEAKLSVCDYALKKAQTIIGNAKAAERFFYVEMRPKMSAIAAGYNSSFNVDITAEDVATATYISCWEDNWAKLRSFKGDTTIHAWVAKIASQATYQMLVEERFIDGVGKTKTNDYRLTIRSIEDKLLRKEIVGMVYVPEMHKALELYYVDKVTDKELAKAFSNAEEAKKWLNAGEKTLIEQLLNTENPFAEMALSLKKAVNPELQWQPWHDRIDDDGISDNQRDFRDILTRIYGVEDWDSNVYTFVRSFINGLGWDEREIDVWTERFFNNTPSIELAEKHHVRNTWIDNTYSRLNKKFKIAIKAWWHQNNR